MHRSLKTVHRYTLPLILVMRIAVYRPQTCRSFFHQLTWSFFHQCTWGLSAILHDKLVLQAQLGTDSICMQGTLYVTVAYTPCDFDKVDDPAVPRVYFKPHQGNAVRFYSCSHSRPQMVPPVEITPGNMFNVHSCWSDMYDAITSAQKFVYLTGWSFHPEISLVRDESDPAKSRPLGELLKEASERGCEVRTCNCLCQAYHRLSASVGCWSHVGSVWHRGWGGGLQLPFDVRSWFFAVVGAVCSRQTTCDEVTAVVSTSFSCV